MSNLETLQKHNTDLQDLIEMAETLPEKGDFAKMADAIIDKSVTEVNSGVTKIGNYAFRYCTELTSVNCPNVASIGSEAFRDCSALRGVNAPNVTSIGTSAFTYATSLQSAHYPKVKKISDGAFYGCYALVSIDFSNATSIIGAAFRGCMSLTDIKFPEVTSVGDYGFYGCEKLIIADFPKLTRVASRMFWSCYQLKSVILRSETLCTLANTDAFTQSFHILGEVNKTYNPNGDKDGYFYVPKALIEDYKVATNWSTFATQFRALEDYTVDGTITGELDPNKI